MTLKQLEQLKKDILQRVPVDIAHRATSTINKAERTQFVAYPKKDMYRKMTQRCEAEGLDIVKVVLALMDSWARYGIDVQVSDDL